MCSCAPANDDLPPKRRRIFVQRDGFNIVALQTHSLTDLSMQQRRQQGEWRASLVSIMRRHSNLFSPSRDFCGGITFSDQFIWFVLPPPSIHPSISSLENVDQLTQHESLSARIPGCRKSRRRRRCHYVICLRYVFWKKWMMNGSLLGSFLAAAAGGVKWRPFTFFCFSLEK